jgi:hypothetical protein
MSPVQLRAHEDSTVRYAGEMNSMLRAMKETAMAEAHGIFRQVTTEEGLTAEEAVRCCPAGEQRAPGHLSVDGTRLLPSRVDTFREKPCSRWSKREQGFETIWGRGYTPVLRSA